ncbi:hypothetical protein P3T36_004403 [Kitasatospora sp. MAP12-15]|uniref:hypothetical protein n=1 Tax=unclassified Kitasatospora TaxID=2633591 RepID=UPI0024755EF7|nr:hypothetical protein [Kitasatospora sp. MAP12-44]MDH6110829.1 hypothetical protein [Kitasatospora sp. MAP12-44]
MRVIHEMRPVGRLSCGAEEWACPTCGRRVTLAGPPEPGLTVLEPGDESAVHVGIVDPGQSAAATAAERYGLGPIQEIPRPPSMPVLPAEPATAAEAAEQDRRWLAEIGIDWDGPAAA